MTRGGRAAGAGPKGMGTAYTIKVRYSLQQLPERRKEHLSNTYRTPQQVRCASVLKVPTLLRLRNGQLAPVKTRRKSVRRRLLYFGRGRRISSVSRHGPRTPDRPSTVIFRPGPW